MPGPKPPAISLTDAERQGLELLVRRYSTGQQKVIRARIILLAATGKNNREIANELDVSLDTARLWRQRWLDLQPISLADLSIEEPLDDLPRPGAPPRLTANQICQIQQLACEKPEKSGRPISQWTSREIAAEKLNHSLLALRWLVDRLTPFLAAIRVMKKTLYHTSRKWLKGSIPASRLHFVADNLNIHKSKSFVRYVAEVFDLDIDLGIKGKSGVVKSIETRVSFLTDTSHFIVFHYTPIHASWMNQVEIWFSILVRKLLRRASFASINDLKAKVLAFVEYFNQTMAKPFKWTYRGRALAA
jgi:transposase